VSHYIICFILCSAGISYGLYNDCDNKIIGLVKTIYKPQIIENKTLLYNSKKELVSIYSYVNVINVRIYFRELIKKFKEKRILKYKNFLRIRNKTNKYNNKILKYII